MRSTQGNDEGEEEMIAVVTTPTNTAPQPRWWGHLHKVDPGSLDWRGQNRRTDAVDDGDEGEGKQMRLWRRSPTGLTAAPRSALLLRPVAEFHLVQPLVSAVFAHLGFRDLLACRLVCRKFNAIVSDPDERLLERFPEKLEDVASSARYSHGTVSDRQESAAWLSSWLAFATVAYIACAYFGLLDGNKPGSALGTILYVIIVVLFSDTIPMGWSFLIDDHLRHDCMVRMIGLLMCAPLLTLSVFLFMYTSQIAEFSALDDVAPMIAECPSLTSERGGYPTYVKFLLPALWAIEPEVWFNFTGLADKDKKVSVFRFRFAQYNGTLDTLVAALRAADLDACADHYIEVLSDVNGQPRPTAPPDTIERALEILTSRAIRWPVMPIFGIEAIDRNATDVWRTVHLTTNSDGWIPTDGLRRIEGGWKRTPWFQNAGLPLVSREGRYPVARSRRDRDITLVVFIVFGAVITGTPLIVCYLSASAAMKRFKLIRASLSVLSAAAFKVTIADDDDLPDWGYYRSLARSRHPPGAAVPLRSDIETSDDETAGSREEEGPALTDKAAGVDHEGATGRSKQFLYVLDDETPLWPDDEQLPSSAATVATSASGEVPPSITVSPSEAR